jgi:glycosyltransferase involved in cell wall biosynthesis
MNSKNALKICMVPKMSGVGGMVSFQQKFVNGLTARGVKVSYDLDDKRLDAVLVVGGTRNMLGLWRARRRGVPIVQRLDGMNWLHRIRSSRNYLPTGVRHYLRSEYGNLILAKIRANLATRIVYQSEFTRKWWHQVHGVSPVVNRVIYNGVDLDRYNPGGSETRPVDRYRILLVEGSLMGGYEQGMEIALRLVGRLAEAHSRNGDLLVELMVVGKASQELRKRSEKYLKQQQKEGLVFLNWAGQIPGDRIPAVDRGAHLLYSADVNAACPNSVIEALACGLPVVAFDTGSLPELVRKASGIIVAYGGNPWKLETPDISGLSTAAIEIVENQSRFRQAARQHAEDEFGLDKMVEEYLDFMVPQ